MNTTIHIGQLLLNYFEKHRTRKAALARLLQVKPSAILRYEKRESLQISILINISHALKHNFLMDIAQELPQEYTTNKPLFVEKDAEIEALKKEVETLKTQNQLLMQLMGK